MSIEPPTALNAEPTTGSGHPEYWTTLSEYDRDEEYLSRAGEEFYPDAKPEKDFEGSASLEDHLASPVKRRTFLKFSGFAALAAMIQGCERPVEQVRPYIHKPEEITLGKPNLYASTLTDTGEGYGLLVTCREGRPIKLEGNPDHPVNRGTLSARAQGSIIDLYNPDRIRFPMRLKRSFAGEMGEGLEPDATVKMADLDREIGEKIRTATGKVVLLSRTATGPANERLIADFLAQGRNFEHVVYDPMSGGDERRAHLDAFGEEVTPRYLFDKAAVVVALGGDPLGQGVSPVEYQHGFAKRRDPASAEGMSRVYAFEPVPSLTGMSADYRFVVRPEHLIAVGLGLANLLLFGGAEYAGANASSFAGNADVRRLVEPFTAARVAKDTGIAEKELQRVAASLHAHPGRSIVYTQGTGGATASSGALALVGVFLNSICGNYAETIDATLSPSMQAMGDVRALLGLVNDLKAGAVSVLIVNGVNPVYTLPPSAGFAEALGKAGYLVTVGRMMDETAALCDVAVPGVHGLEGWGDAQPQRGVLGLQQPAVRRIFGELAANVLYDTRAWQESLMAFVNAAGAKTFIRELTQPEIQAALDDAGTTDTLTLAPGTLGPQAISWYQYLRETWRERVFAKGSYAAKDFDTFWNGAVQKGLIDLVGEDARKGSFSAPTFKTAALSAVTAPEASGTVLVAYATVVHGDGESMGNPFLLELPDPASKICWDNYAAISPAMAESLDLKDGEHVEVTANGESITVPVFVQPGTHPDVVGVMLGWGRNAFGGVGDAIGGNAFKLAKVHDGRVATAGAEVKIARVSGKTNLANTQGHNYLFSNSMAGLNVNEQHGDAIPENAQLNEQGKPVYDRPILGETTLNEWKKNPFHAYPNNADHNTNPPSMWEASHKYVGHHWGLAVDLNACNGCGACMVACSVENNVPVVGRYEVQMGREMHWIRIDRYYRGDKNNPDFVQMPLMCQHCDNAPCETVCPVIATMHNDEGLNVMVYNRCVGTRYCANNCPYKVRRFNFWQYTDFRTGPDRSEGSGDKRVSPLELVLNPDVTTRTRGVMEKCSFCIQRIRRAKDTARDTGEPLPDGAMVTACQQTCPAKAITFGDRNDRNSAVTKKFLDPRSYGLLVDLNTDPSVRYLALVRNRDEPSPYRTKYQAHRLHKAHDKHSHDDHGSGEAGHDHSTDAPSQSH